MKVFIGYRKMTPVELEGVTFYGMALAYDAGFAEHQVLSLWHVGPDDSITPLLLAMITKPREMRLLPARPEQKLLPWGIPAQEMEKFHAALSADTLIDHLNEKRWEC